ncbi:hypothetical protein AA15973_1379 [Komagataeibacter sucrofermentans DSM 15973]|nr:hypothetical protein AA15973_1379 [Komagataeibacter sucrofermentans DSM 15973]
MCSSTDSTVPPTPDRKPVAMTAMAMTGHAVGAPCGADAGAGWVMMAWHMPDKAWNAKPV